MNALAALLAAGSLAAASGTCPAQSVVAPFSQGTAGTAPPSGWAELAFPRIPRHTHYELVADGGTRVVAAHAEGSASGWIHRLDVPASQARMLRWRWMAEELPAKGDARTRANDDAAARVYVAFRYASERLAWPLRLLYELVRAIYGELPPYATLMYVWDERSAAGTTFDNPYTDRVRTIVVESGRARLGQWLDYERDVVADYAAAFDGEPPPISGVAIMTDADNTGSRAAARYGDITLSPQ